MSLIFVDCEASGPCPEIGHLTEFGAVEFKTRQTFHGRLWDTYPDPANSAIPRRTGPGYNPTEIFLQFEKWLKQFDDRPIFVSDNSAYDFQWINHGFWKAIGRNPFGHSARRIGDFYAGLKGNFYTRQDWKKLRKTKHDHNPVNDAMGNLEAFEELLRGRR